MPLLLEDVEGTWLVNAGSVMLVGMAVMWISQIISFGCRRDRQAEDAAMKKARKARKARKMRKMKMNDEAKSSFGRLTTPSNLGGPGQALTFVEYAVLQGDSWMHMAIDSNATLLLRKYEREGNITDLNSAIESMSQVVSLAPQSHPAMLVYLNNLVTMFHKRFEHLGKMSDMDKAIEYNTLAVSLAPPGHNGLPVLIHNLGSVLYHRFERLGELPDLDKSLEYSIQAISLTPQGHFSMPALLNNLGLTYRSRFKRLGELSDLDKAIAHITQAVSLTPRDSLFIARLLNNLGLSLHNRFQRLGELSDLDKAIDCLTQATAFTSQKPHEMSASLNNLGSAFSSRFERFGEVSDLDSAVKYQTQAVSLMPGDHPDNLMLLNNLGLSLQSRFGLLGELSDLERAIEYKIKAVALAPQGHTFLPVLLTNLGSSFRNRFKCLSELSDLDKAIDSNIQAVSLTPGGHSLMPAYLYKLGLLHLERSEHSDSKDNIDQALDCFQKAAESAVGDPCYRFDSACEWARLCSEHQALSLIHAYQRAMTLLPQLFWLGTGLNNRYRSIAKAGDITTEAAAAAIKMENYELAIEWLEEGRSILWKQMLQLRTPIDSLFLIAPALAMELEQVAHELEHASSSTSHNIGALQDTIPLERAAQQHHRHAGRWQELLDEVRSLPGFSNFLRPRKASELMRSAQSGPIVVINVHQSRCDALVIKPGASTILHVPLGLSFETARRSQAQLLDFVRSKGLSNRGFQIGNTSRVDTLGRMLLVLWTEVVKPVLACLGYMTNPTPSDLPHVTWCTTGPLSFLPLHAAGDYAAQFRTFDYVVSSYTTTLSALLSPPLDPTLFSGILAVGQSSTSDLPPLPGTLNELSQIQEKSTELAFKRLDGELATPTAVLAAIEEHSWVHLACHAKQDATHLLGSGFYLHGGMLDLASIMKKELKHADLAFLSACQTATGDERVSEESVHLAAGMLMAGYRGVIATMWSIRDDDAPLVAEKVYEHLLEGGKPDARRAAVAVHKATACLREKVGVNAFEKWVPYIHIGH